MVHANLQRFGGFLTQMVIPNVGAFLAWGLITALFIPWEFWGHRSSAEFWGHHTQLLAAWEGLDNLRAWLDWRE